MAFLWRVPLIGLLMVVATIALFLGAWRRARPSETFWGWTRTGITPTADGRGSVLSWTLDRSVTTAGARSLTAFWLPVGVVP